MKNMRKNILVLKLWLRKKFIEALCKTKILEISDSRFEVLFIILIFKLKMTSFLNNPNSVNVRKEFKNYIEVYLFGMNILHFKFYTDRLLSFSKGAELFSAEDKSLKNKWSK